MISISAYRRYPQPQWYYRQTRPRPAPEPPAAPAAPKEQPEREARPQPGPATAARRPFLPADLDSGDLFLAALLLFLYSESHDEEFLIILIVVGISIFQKNKDSK